jgi:aryl-alcohol dehydrogenase-like predicted oxidoreductase
MHTRTLSHDLQVSAIGLGCMGMSQSYGPNPGDRTAMIKVQVVLATKFGWRIENSRSTGLDSRPEQIRRVADASLTRSPGSSALVGCADPRNQTPQPPCGERRRDPRSTLC